MSLLTAQIKEFLTLVHSFKVHNFDGVDLLSRALKELEGQAEQIDEFYHVMNGFVEAYPESMFPEIISEDYKKVHAVLTEAFGSKSFVSRLHGCWGRHISTKIHEALPTPPEG